MRPTRRGVAVSVAAALLLAAGLGGGYPMFTALGAVAAGALLAAVATAAGELRIEVRRAVHPERVERGRPALVRLRVRNAGRRRRAAFLATDVLGGQRRTVRVRALPSGAEVTHHYELPTTDRGRRVVGPLALHRVDPLGLVRNRLATGETATLWVHPRQLPVRVPAGVHPRHHHDGAVPDGALRGSVEMRDIRPYSPGDEARHLHWKATARTGRLMVRELADPPRGRLTVLLDDRAGALAAATFEEAVDLTASLLCAAARSGRSARLVTPSGRDLTIHGGAERVVGLLDLLCELGQDGAPDLPPVPPSLSSGSGPAGALVVVAAGGGLEPAARSRRRYAPVTVVILAGSDVDPAGLPVLLAADAEQAVRLWNEAGS